MASESFREVTTRRLLGVLFLALAVGLVTLSIAIYNKAFTSVVSVKMEANEVGNQLQKGSTVAVRGVEVGMVTSVHVRKNLTATRPDATVADIEIALDPGMVKDIPCAVRADSKTCTDLSAQVLPKTLFGEQYVALTVPANASGRHIHAGDVISQDRTKGALEAQDVISNLLPLLQAVQPAQLKATLDAVAQALTGRGKQLGQTLDQLDQYLRSTLNPNRQSIVDDVQKLGQVSVEYNAIAPNLFQVLNNLQTTVKTVTDKAPQLAQLLTTATTTANTVTSFIQANQQNAISIVGETDQVFRLLKEYSPEYKCLFSGLTQLSNKANLAVHNNAINLSATLDTTNAGKYVNGNQPILIAGYGPNCFGLPNNPTPVVNGKFQIPEKYQCVNDGVALSTNPCGATPSSRPRYPSGTSSSDTSSQLASNAQQSAVINALIAPSLGTTPDKVPGGITLLTQSLLQGNQVVVGK